MKIDVPSKQIMIFIMSPSNLSKVYPCSMYLCGRGFYCCVGNPSSCVKPAGKDVS